MNRSTRRISPAAFSLVFINVDPAAFKALRHYFYIFLAERLHRFERELFRLLIGYLHVNAAHHWRIEVVIVQLVDPEQLLAQLHIAVHFVHVRVNRFNKTVINALRNFRAVERSFKRVFVTPRVGVERKRFKVSRKDSRIGVFVALICVVQVRKSGSAQFSVLALHERDIASVGYLVSFSLGIHRVWEFHIRIVQHGKNRAWRIRHFARHCDNALLGRRKDMLAAL